MTDTQNLAGRFNESAPSFHDLIERGVGLDYLERMIRKGADINERDTWKCTPLIKTIKRRYFGIAKMLIENGADINLQDKAGDTALMLACESMPDKEMAKLLIEKGAALDVANNTSGYTALFKTAIYGTPQHVEIARLLIEKGVDLDIRDNNGNTALDVARERNNTAIVDVIETALAARAAAEAERARLAEDAARTAAHAARHDAVAEKQRHLKNGALRRALKL